MNTLKNLALTALLAVAAVGCKNDSPIPQTVVVTPKPVNNSPCYTGKVLYGQRCGAIVVQIENVNIGITDTVGSRYCNDFQIPTKVYENVVCLVTDFETRFTMRNEEKIYFTIDKYLEKSGEGDVANNYLACAALLDVSCSSSEYIPNKFIKVKKYSLLSCEDLKTK